MHNLTHVSGEASGMGAHPALQRKPDAGWQLCAIVTDWNGRVPAGGVIVEPKIDGIRALYIDGELVTREGSPIYGVEHILQVLRAMEHEAAEPMFFDGELQVRGSLTETIRHFKAANGNGDAGILHLFDAIPMHNWRNGGPTEALEARRPKLDRMAEGFANHDVRLLPWAFMTDADEIREKAREYIAAGGEGLVVKHALSTYRRTSGAAWQRVKPGRGL